MEPILILSNLPPSATTSNLLSLLPKSPMSGGVIKAEVVSSSDLFPTSVAAGGSPNKKESGAAATLRYGFIAFELDSDADAAQSLFDGFVLDGYKVSSVRQTLGELELSMAQSIAAVKGKDETTAVNNKEDVAVDGSQAGADSAAATAAAAAAAEKQQQQQRGYAAATSAAQKVGLHGALRYPFAPMHLGWLHEYISGLDPNTEQLVAMCRVLECLMGNAVSTCDPFLEHAVVNFYTKFQPSVWGRVQTQQSASVGSPVGGLTFELSRQVFEVIGLIRRFPGATAKSRKMLLTLVERVLEDVSRVTKDSPSMQHIRDIPDVVKSVHEAVGKLRALHLAQQASIEAEQELEKSRAERKAVAQEQEEEGSRVDDDDDKKNNQKEDDENASTTPTTVVAVPPAPSAYELDEALSHLTSWLRYLFFALSSTKPILVPACPPPPPGVQVVVPCSETCACFERMQRCPSVHLADVEKVKVIDGLLVSGFGATAEEEMAAFARELLSRYSIDFCARAVSQVQNGQFAIARFHVFEALRLARRSQSIATVAGIVEDWRSLDLIDLALQHAAATCSAVHELAAVVDTLVPDSQTCLTRVRAARASVLMQRHQQSKHEQHAHQTTTFPASPASSDLFALQKYISDIFKMLCNQQFLLCVHYVPYDAEVAAAQALEKHIKEQQQRKQQQEENISSSSSSSSPTPLQLKRNDAVVKNDAAAAAAPPPPSAASQPPPVKPLPGPPKCANPTCGTARGELLKCSACKVTWYCSRTCQQADWKTHKAFCKATAAERAQQAAAASPTAAAAQWLFERSEKATAGSRFCDIRPCI